MNRGLLSEGDTGGDIIDMAFQTGAIEVNSHISEIQCGGLGAVNAALKKYEADQRLRKERGRKKVRPEELQFGKCEQCQNEIGIERMQAIPETPFCITCIRGATASNVSQTLNGKEHWNRVSEPSAIGDYDNIRTMHIEE